MQPIPCQSITTDVTRPLPLEAESVDVCFLSTVLHILNIDRVGSQLFEEARRVLKPGGRVAVVECKKEEADFGPPLSRRLSPEDVSVVAERAGLGRSGYVDLGHTYLVLFTLDAIDLGLAHAGTDT